MPLTIDGSNPTSITIDGENVREITIDGENVWSASGIEVTASVNTDTVEMIWYEDTTGDGEPDNQTSFTLQDGNNTYSASSLELLGGNNIWFEVVDENRTITEEVSISNIKLQY